MRPLAHLLSVLLVLPGMALAAAFLILDRAIGAGSLPGLLGALLEVAVWLIPWGLLAVCVALLLLIGAGCSPRWRWLAAVCVALLAIGSACVVIALTARHDAFSAAQLPFFLPGLLAAAIALWLLANEFPRARTFSGAPRNTA